MRIPLVSLVLAWSTLTALAPPLAASPAARPAPAKQLVQAATSPEQGALHVARAAFAGDSASVRAMALTFAELAAFSMDADRPGAKARWDEELDEFIERAASEGRRSKLTVVDAKVVKAGTLKAAPGERRRRDVDYAIVQVWVAQPGAEPAPRRRPFIFVRTELGWKFSPKQ